MLYVTMMKIGGWSKVRIYHACRDLRNAGDYIGNFLYNAVTGKAPEWTNNFKAKYLMVAGSILQEASDKAIVLGAGFGNYDQKLSAKPKLLIVRGKLTADKLVEQGFRETWKLGDPGLFLPFVYKPNVETKYKLGVVPHYIDKDLVPTGYHTIDICQPVAKVINSIVECEAIISSSLHGLIIAHAYGIPALWVEFSDNVAGDGFKFLDYFSSVGIDPYEPINCRLDIPELDIPSTTIELKQFRAAFNLFKRTVS